MKRQPFLQSTPHIISEEDVIRFKEREADASKKFECLLNEYLDETGRPLTKRKSTSKKKETFDIGKFV